MSSPTIFQMFEAAPRRWVCQTCGKVFGHRPKRERHRGEPKSVRSGMHCDGPVKVFVMLPEGLVRRLIGIKGEENDGKS